MIRKNRIYGLVLGAGCLLGGCSTRGAPAAAPSPAQETGPPAAAADGRAADAPSARPSPPTATRAGAPPPISEAAELAVLQREAAEDAADSALIETIAAGDSAATTAEDPSGSLDNPLSSAGVTWDIDVASYEDHGRVRYWVDFFSGRAHDRFGIWLERMARYEPMIRARLAEQNLPSDLIYLALIESGFSNSAVSRSRAVGMWQFMRPTALGIGLRVDRWMDERRDPVRATDAAAKHLDMLRRQFGSLYLAAAAYNAGGGKVSRSLKKMERMRPARGDAEPEDDADDGWDDDDFFALHDTPLLRQETRDYVPKLIAAAIIAKEPARYGFTDLKPAPLFEADTLVVDDMTGLDVIARLAGTSVATIRELNPQYLRWATPPGRASVVRVPKGTGDSASAAYASLPKAERVTFASHRVRKGETLSGVARRYGVSLVALRDANPGTTSRLRVGAQLLVPRGGALSAAAARNVRAAESAEYHRVRRGETASGIARRYGIRLAELKSWNRGRMTARGGIRAGTNLLVSEPVGAAPAGRAASTARTVRTAAAPGKSKAAARGRVRSHTVRPGDTLTGLAKRYGTSVAALQRANKLSGGAIRAGQRLKIPA